MAAAAQGAPRQHAVDGGAQPGGGAPMNVQAQPVRPQGQNVQNPQGNAARGRPQPLRGGAIGNLHDYPIVQDLQAYGGHRGHKGKRGGRG